MKTLAVIGSGSDVYREYVFRALDGRYRVVLVQDTEPTWQRRYLSSAEVVDTTDPDAVVAAVRRHQPDGVLTWMESQVETTAWVAAALGLPGHPRDAAVCSRDKLLMRRRWSRRGVPSAACEPAEDVTAALRAAARIGYPVVVKPRALAASVGVVAVHEPRQLVEAFTVARNAELDRFQSAPRGVLVEEFLQGPEVSVETVVQGGRARPVAITAKRTAFAPFFEEVGHVVALDNALAEREDIFEVVVSAHEALGLRDGVTHAELKLTAAGPRMVEIGARLGGDQIPRLVQLATGIDLARAAAAVAVGDRPDLTPRWSRAAGIAFRYPEHDGRIESLELSDDLGKAADVHELRWTACPGMSCLLPPGGFVTRLGHVVVTAPNAGCCWHRLGEASAGMRVTMTSEPSDVPSLPPTAAAVAR